MLRQLASSCHQTLSSTAKAVITRVSQGSFFSQQIPPFIPAVQFLTIPLKDKCNKVRWGRGRHYSTTTNVLSTPSSSFKEDYDEWYSHGRVGSVTSTSTDEEIYYQGNESTFNGVQYGFLLDELKEEESIVFDAHLPQNNMFSRHEEELAFEEGDDDFLDDLDFTQEVHDALEDS